MLFVRLEDLKAGMRLARPIYNRNGVLLYERDSKLTLQSIMGIRNFGLIGIYILEPAEPVPPMTRDDLEFERFQTMYVFSIQEELTFMLRTKRAKKLNEIANQIIHAYGNLSRRIHFVQNLRSKEDQIYKHSLNVAILCAMTAHTMHASAEEQRDAVISALVHDVGKLKENTSTAEDTKGKTETYWERIGLNLLEKVFYDNNNIRRCCAQAFSVRKGFETSDIKEIKPITSAKILLAAQLYDDMTAMRTDGEPYSEVAAVRTLLENPEVFDQQAVDALIHSIHILSPGTCVELSTGEEGLVLTANEYNVLKPVVLGFRDNVIYDLSNELAYGDIEITDIMKTMDNRYKMDTELLKQQGIPFEEPDYVD